MNNLLNIPHNMKQNENENYLYARNGDTTFYKDHICYLIL